MGSYMTPISYKSSTIVIFEDCVLRDRMDAFRMLEISYTAQLFTRISIMWFRNLVAFYFEETPEYTQEMLESKLVDRGFQACGSQEPFSLGWTPPMGRQSDQYSHWGSGAILLTARREERLLPASVVKEAVMEKVELIEAEQERRVTRKERIDMRDEMTFELMPKAFTRSSLMAGMILPEQRLLIIDSTSWAKAEEWVSLLRETLGSLAVRPVEMTQSVSDVFTGWLGGNTPVPSHIEIGDECELRSMEETAAVVKCRHQDLGSQEIIAHIKAGKIVVKLSMNWGESLSFLLSDNLEIKRLQFSDTLIEQASEDGAADAAAEFDASFALMSLELARFLPALWELFGGVNETV